MPSRLHQVHNTSSLSHSHAPSISRAHPLYLCRSIHTYFPCGTHPPSSLFQLNPKLLQTLIQPLCLSHFHPTLSRPLRQLVHAFITHLQLLWFLFLNELSLLSLYFFILSHPFAHHYCFPFPLPFSLSPPPPSTHQMFINLSPVSVMYFDSVSLDGVTGCILKLEALQGMDRYEEAITECEAHLAFIKGKGEPSQHGIFPYRSCNYLLSSWSSS